MNKKEKENNKNLDEDFYETLTNEFLNFNQEKLPLKEKEKIINGLINKYNENKIVKNKIKKLEEENKNLNNMINNLNKDSLKELIDGFDKIIESSKKTTKNWLFGVLIGFIFLGLLAAALALDRIVPIYIIPISIVFMSWIYFSAYNYSKYRNINIDFNNRKAIAQGYKGMLNENIKSEYVEPFLKNVGNVLFKDIKHYKERTLPLDELMKIKELLRK